MARPNGFVLWRGLSLIDGVTPIVAIVTGTAGASANGKTGQMLQTWIMREDMDPHTAVRTGADAAVCGDCKHRPAPQGEATLPEDKGACYVRVYQAPLSVWRAWRNWRYPAATTAVAIAAIGAGRAVRIGSYGDPAAVPAAVWSALISGATMHTGYTHQWRNAPALQGLCMASTDTPAERDEARAAGWRTFTVRLASDALAERESVCPASKEAGALTNCATCGACNGTATQRKGSIAIVAHGALAKRYITIRSAV